MSPFLPYLCLALSLIRVKKSMSTGENLKEAQAINLSLSALGDVISALATSQQHIPYRNHKLTMLMSDSLGGNAKTLMFVNVSPTDGNLDETQNSLQYATRVRTIKVRGWEEPWASLLRSSGPRGRSCLSLQNSASKNEMSKDMIKMKKMIEYWKEQAGLSPEQRAQVDLVDVTEERTVENDT